MEIKLKQINDWIVKPIKTNINTKPILGEAIMPLWSNAYLVAPTAGGKTTAILTMLKAICHKNTKIVAFVSSIYNDDNWQAIKDWAEDKGLEWTDYLSIMEDGVDQLAKYVKQFTEEAKERERQKRLKKIMDKMKGLGFVYQDKTTLNVPGRGKKDIDKGEDKKPRESKYQYAEYVFIFDDLADEIHSKSYETLSKKARHFHITCITSSQDVKDMKKAARFQVRVWLLFNGLTKERLEEVYQATRSNLSFEVFKELYDNSVKEPYGFLYIRPRQSEYRKTFTRKFIV